MNSKETLSRRNFFGGVGGTLVGALAITGALPQDIQNVLCKNSHESERRTVFLDPHIALDTEAYCEDVLDHTKVHGYFKNMREVSKLTSINLNIFSDGLIKDRRTQRLVGIVIKADQHMVQGQSITNYHLYDIRRSRVVPLVGDYLQIAIQDAEDKLFGRKVG